ncbi:ExbD/TolR family protein [Chrysiogenes arsenatis]|uniref:ExbD/TolR family protein n=1 Tax=Chrysiogenes arsenatis TaxID=309797 RepID=UPI00040D9784|nr:biopolymer transporter ExbD [Chrysiogenes arsenatis]
MKLRRDFYQPMAEINIIPLVDIVLVLLIIFMVTAPLLQHGITVELPESQASLKLDEQKTQVVVTVNHQGKIAINDVTMDIATFRQRLKGLVAIPDKTYEVVIEGDRRVDYGAIVAVMDAVKGEGITSIGLVTK